ncbi:MAG: hypothetical protein C3F08_06185 [Candidatus Methylomirabilota bacterium]|nr:MAG: hypothetical protein C3F08_06185 [candidate division NC10 bacterium]
MGLFEAFVCDGCTRVSVRADRCCRYCGASAVLPVILSGHGTLASFTTIRVPPTVFQGQEPYNIAVIDLDEGLRVTARLTVAEGREATIGDPVIFEEMRSYGPMFCLS